MKSGPGKELVTSIQETLPGRCALMPSFKWVVPVHFSGLLSKFCLNSHSLGQRRQVEHLCFSCISLKELLSQANCHAPFPQLPSTLPKPAPSLFTSTLLVTFLCTLPRLSHGLGVQRDPFQINTVCLSSCSIKAHLPNWEKKPSPAKWSPFPLVYLETHFFICIYFMLLSCNISPFCYLMHPVFLLGFVHMCVVLWPDSMFLEAKGKVILDISRQGAGRYSHRSFLVKLLQKVRNKGDGNGIRKREEEGGRI